MEYDYTSVIETIKGWILMKRMSLLRTLQTHITFLQNYYHSIGIPWLEYSNPIIFELYKDDIKKIYSNEYISVLKEGSGGVKNNGWYLFSCF